RASTESIPGSVQRDANCTIISARPAAQRSAGPSICVQITLVSRFGVSTTGISRLPWRRSGRRRCALGQCCHQAFSISRALDRFRARAGCEEPGLKKSYLIRYLLLRTHLLTSVLKKMAPSAGAICESIAGFSRSGFRLNRFSRRVFGHDLLAFLRGIMPSVMALLDVFRSMRL